METIVTSLFIIALGTGVCCVVLNKNARRRMSHWYIGYRHKRPKEDRETLQALYLGLGLVFGIFFQIVGLFSIINFLFGGPPD